MFLPDRLCVFGAFATRRNGDEGNRTIPVSASKTPISPNGLKNSTQDGTPKGDFDPDLAFIVAHWHSLPDRVKREIRDTVQPYAKTPDADARRQAVLDALRQAHDDDQNGDRTYRPKGGEP